MKMRFGKAISCLMIGLFGIILAGAFGCTMNKNAIYQKMVSYISNKYNDSFEFVTSYGGRPGSSFHSIYVKSKQYPNAFISVSCNEVNGDDVFFDNYLAVKYEEQTRELLNNIMNGYGTEILLFYNAGNYAYTENGTENTTFEEFIREKTSSIIFTALIKTDFSPNHELIEEKLKQDMSSYGICCSGILYFCLDNPEFEQLNANNLFSGYLSKKTYDSSCFFQMTEDGKLTNVEWGTSK